MTYRSADIRLCDLCEENLPHDIRESVAVCRPCLTKISGHWVFNAGIRKAIFKEEGVIGWLTEKVVIWLNPESKLLLSHVPLVPIYRRDLTQIQVEGPI